jgi:hypothetical protein
MIKISAQGIENMLVTFVIHDYGVEKEEVWKDTDLAKRHLSILFTADSKLKSILIGWDY